jgi:predicted negative regulator of RcsB-dependent stress response
MRSFNLSPRTILVCVAGLLAVGLVLVAGLVLALVGFMGWGATALEKVNVATSAVVSQAREEATRELDQAKDEVAAAVATATSSSEEAARALQDASTTVAGVREALAEPEAALNRVTDAVAQEVERTAVAAAAAAVPVLSEQAESAKRALDALSGPDPAAWPEGLALRQLDYRKGERVTEYAYVATEGFDLAGMREQLVALGYAEHVIAEGGGGLEAVYRGDRQLVLSAFTRDGQQYIDLQETELAAPPSPDR